MKFDVKDSVGLVEEQNLQLSGSFELECKESVSGINIRYETYGTLNHHGSNAIYICHALTGNHHAAGYYKANEDAPNFGWWEVAIGPNKAIDTNRFFVVCANNLGGCHGTTGPNSINPNTKQKYGSTFPFITVLDWVKLQIKLMEYLKIEKWYAVVGGSLGGMQALQWAISYPDKLQHCVLIASTAKLSTQNIAFNEVARSAISQNPEQQNNGLKIARMLGHITYLSSHSLNEKFARKKIDNKKHFNPHKQQFEVEGYLHHQGDKFPKEFNSDTYMLITKALDYFDPADEHEGDLVKTLQNVSADFFVCSFTGDWRFPPYHSDMIVSSLVANRKNVCYTLIPSKLGHDDFLIKNKMFLQQLETYLIANFNA